MASTRRTSKTVQAATDETSEAKAVAADIMFVTEWFDTLDQDEKARYNDLYFKYRNSTLPTVSSVLEFFGLDPNVIPSNNAFYTNGFITFRERVGEGEMTVDNYRDAPPKLNAYPEGMSFELVSSALRYDTWRLS